MLKVKYAYEIFLRKKTNCGGSSTSTCLKCLTLNQAKKVINFLNKEKLNYEDKFVIRKFETYVSFS